MPGKKRNPKKLAPPLTDHAAPRPMSRSLIPWCAVLALCAITVIAYTNSFDSGFILDNKQLLLDPRIREATRDNLALIFERSYWWPTGEAGLYRPFTTLSYLFNYAILGDHDQPAGYHLVNLLLHLANVLLAYTLALRLLRKMWPAAFIAVLWAVHPVLTESVTNIVGRADLLAATAVLAGLLSYIRASETHGLAKGLWLAALALATTIGVFSKESAVAIFPVIALYEITWWKERPNHKTLWLASAATLLPTAAMLFVRFKVLSGSPPAEFPFTDNPIVGVDWWTGRLTAVQVMKRYLELVLWPWKLSCDYSYNVVPVATGARGKWLAWLVIVTAVAAFAWLYRRNRTCFFLAGFAFLNFVPASNLLFPIGTIMAERLMYLPALGLAGCLVLGFYAIASKPRMAWLPPVALGLITAALAVRTWVRNVDWQTELTMATSSLQASPNSFKLHRLLASALFESDPTHANIDPVIAEQEKSVAILGSLAPQSTPPDVYRMAGYYYLVKGNAAESQHLEGSGASYQKAVQTLERSISIDETGRGHRRYTSLPQSAGLPTGDSQAYLLLSIACLRAGDLDRATQAVHRALEIDPLEPRVYQQLADVLDAQQRSADADTAALVTRAITSERDGNWQDAAESSAAVLRSDGKSYSAAYYLNAMANFHVGKLDMAEASARRAIELGPQGLAARAGYVLGLVLAEKRDFVQASKFLRGYLEAIPNAPDTPVVRGQLRDIEREINPLR